MAVVSVGERYDMLNAKGQWLLPLEYEHVFSDFEQGLTLVKKGGLCGYANLAAELVIWPKYTDAWNFCHTGLGIL